MTEKRITDEDLLKLQEAIRDTRRWGHYVVPHSTVKHELEKVNDNEDNYK